MAFFFVISYKINKNAIIALWHIFLTIFPFQRGRYFLSFVVEKEFWGGNFPINIEYYFKFSDFIILCLIGLFLRLKVLHGNSNIFDTRSPKELFFLFFFLIIAGLSSFNATYTSFAFYQYLTFSLVVSLSVISGLIQRYKPHLNFVFPILLIHCFVLVALLCLQFRKGSQLGIELEQVSDESPFGSFQVEAQNKYRPGGYFFDPNAAGTLIITILPLVVYKIVGSEKNRFENLFYVFLLFFAIVGLIITSSRFVWIVTLLLGFFYLSQKKYRQLAIRLFTKYKKFAILMGVTSLLFIPLIILRLSNFSYTFSSGGGIDYRLSHYLLSLQYILNNPFGIGLGMFKYEILGNFPPELFSYDPTSPHNILVEVAVGSGILGLFSFCIFLYFSFKRQFVYWLEAKDDFFLAIFLCGVCYITASQAYPYLLRSPLAEIFWIMIGLSFLAEKKGTIT